MVVRLYPKPPFDFALALRYLRRSDLESVDVVRDGCYRRLLEHEGQYRLVEVNSVGSVDAPCLEVSFPDGEVGSAAAVALAENIARMFCIGVDVQAFYARIEQDTVLAALAQRFHGLRPVLTATVFESLAWAVIGQQVNLRFAYSLKQRLVAACAPSAVYGSERYYGFPGPEALAGLSVSDLTGMKFSGRKGEYLLGLAWAVAGGELDLPSLAGISADAVIERLTACRGIGRWTAEYCLLRGLGHPDVLLAADIGLRNAVTAGYQMPKQATEAQVRELGENWSGWRSYANFYLWQSLSEAKRQAVQAARQG